MAISKDEIDKYIFDPENPRNNESYNYLLDSLEEDEGYSIFSNTVLLYIMSKTDIYKKSFKRFANKLPSEIPKDRFNKSIIENIEEYMKELEQFRIFSKIAERTSSGSFYINHDINISNLLINNRKNEHLSTEMWRSKEDRAYIFFFEHLNLPDLDTDKISILITLEKNKDDFIEKEIEGVYPIFLKKMEDLDKLLETLERDLYIQEQIDSHQFGYLGAIKIKNYFSIKDIEIIDLKDKREIYFVGGNGDGKTILLQAILLALKKEYSGDIVDYIKEVKNDMKLSVQDEFSEDYSNNKNIKNIFAYGINRNKTREVFDTYGYNGLFDTSDFKKTTFLKKPLDVLKSDNNLIKEFIEKLNRCILIDTLKIVENDEGIVLEDKGSVVEVEKLSEGYKSTLIWLCDLVSRLIENQEDEDKKITKLKYFKAIVLIDEVDLYLHPKWKYDFIYNLRMVFPRIQFIMITHSTATILGASKKAIFYKVYKENGETKISQPMGSIKNLMANNLSTSPLFDMTTARARNSDENIDTRKDFISSKIHKIIKERVKGKKAIVEDDIEDMINQELDDFLKENNL